MMRLRSFLSHHCENNDELTLESLSDCYSDGSSQSRLEVGGREESRQLFRHGYIISGIWDDSSEHMDLSSSTCSGACTITRSSISLRGPRKVTNLSQTISSLNALHEACRLGLHNVVEELLKQHVFDVNVTDSGMDHGVTPLHVALIHSHKNQNQSSNSIVKLLLSYGANVNYAANNGWTPLHIAASNGQTDTIQLLLQHNANPNAKENRGWTPLFVACFRGHIHVVELLLQYHPENETNHTLHMLQPQSTQDPLPANKIDMINTPDVHGQTLLMTACQRGHVDIVKLLLQHGAHLHMKDEQGSTAWDFSSKSCEILHLLYLHASSLPSSSSPPCPPPPSSSSSSSCGLQLLSPPLKKLTK